MPGRNTLNFHKSFPAARDTPEIAQPQERTRAKEKKMPTKKRYNKDQQLTTWFVSGDGSTVAPSWTSFFSSNSWVTGFFATGAGCASLSAERFTCSWFAACCSGPAIFSPKASERERETLTKTQKKRPVLLIRRRNNITHEPQQQRLLPTAPLQTYHKTKQKPKCGRTYEKAYTGEKPKETVPHQTQQQTLS